MRARERWLAIILGLLWTAFVYASFYLVQQQRPFDSVRVQRAWKVLQASFLIQRGRSLDRANWVAVASALLDLLVAVATVLIGVGLGRRLCRWLGLRPMTVGEQLVLGGGIGLGALSFLVLAVGLLGWLRRWVMVSLFSGLALLSLPDLVAIGRACTRMRAMSRPSWGLGLYLIGTLTLALLVALAPPTDWDGLFYHLTMPRLYIDQGRVAPMTDIPHQHFPGLMEMLYLAAMLLKGDVAAKLLHYGYMLLLGGAIYLLAERHVGSGYGWPAVVAYAAMPMVPVLGSWAYNDLALGFCQIAALYAFFSWSQGRASSWLALSGALCGLAMGLKYTSFVCPLTVALLMAWHLARVRAPRASWLRAFSLLGGAALVVAAPWYLRNLAFTGNPVYPFAYGLFDGRGWDDWRAAWYARAGSGLGWAAAELLKLPWTLTLGVRDMNFYDGRMGPLFLLALPFAIAWAMRLLRRPRSPPQAVGDLLVYAAIQYAFWVLGVVHSRSLFQSRLLLPAFAALCAPLAYLFEELRVLDTRLFSLRRLIGMSVALVLAANFCYQSLDTLRIHPLPVLVGEESGEEYLTRNLGAHYAAMRSVNERVPEDGRVLFLWEPRSYYCRRAVQPDPILERWAWLHYQHDGEPRTIARALRDEGYTHVLLHRAGLEFMRQNQLDPLSDAHFAALETFTQVHLRQEARVGEAYQLYRLRAPDDQDER